MRKADNLPPSCAVVTKTGNINFLETSGSLRACNGNVLPFIEYAIRRVQVNQGGLKLNGTYQLLAYVDYVNILGGSIYTLKENAEALLAATSEIGLEVSADKTKHMVMSQDKNSQRED